MWNSSSKLYLFLVCIAGSISPRIEPAGHSRQTNTSDAFQFAPRGQFGSAGINILHGPHVTVFDFSLMRDFSITKRVNLQFRWGVFNLTNTPMFSLPISSLNSGTVGTVSRWPEPPRHASRPALLF
jgi:hypothetical protein